MPELLKTQNNEAETTALLIGVLFRDEEEWRIKETMDELSSKKGLEK